MIFIGHAYQPNAKCWHIHIIKYIEESYNVHVQVLQAGITWKECTELPAELSAGKTIVINGKVYCGGGGTDLDNQSVIYCYDQSQDKWTTLLPLPVKWFGLGQVNSKLVAVGGVKTRDDKRSNEVYTYDDRSLKWKQTIPPMPTARNSVGVLSLQSALVVVGGGKLVTTTKTLLHSCTAAVEIFKPATSQWYRTDPLPIPCQDISLVAIGNTCYALGGYKSSFLSHALYASVDHLLCNAVPANQITHRSSDTQSAWKMLPNTPTYSPAAATLAGNLFAVGGCYEETLKKEVYMYSPSTNSWIYISDLPAPRSGIAVAVLSSIEILVIGGKYSLNIGCRVNTVHRGALHID